MIVIKDKLIYFNKKFYLQNIVYGFHQDQMYAPQIIPEEKINELKDYYSKKKGYTEHNPKTILNFLYEYRIYQKV